MSQHAQQLTTQTELDFFLFYYSNELFFLWKREHLRAKTSVHLILQFVPIQWGRIKVNTFLNLKTVLGVIWGPDFPFLYLSTAVSQTMWAGRPLTCSAAENSHESLLHQPRLFVIHRTINTQIPSLTIYREQLNVRTNTGFIQTNTFLTSLLSFFIQLKEEHHIFRDPAVLAVDGVWG